MKARKRAIKSADFNHLIKLPKNHMIYQVIFRRNFFGLCRFMSIQFQTFFDEQQQLHQQQAQFFIDKIEYTIIFASSPDLSCAFAAQIDDETPCQYEKSYSVKFAASQAIETFQSTGNSDDLYRRPQGQFYAYTEVKKLYHTLNHILLEHQRLFQAQCYYFVAETPSLGKTYHRLCTMQSKQNTIEFKIFRDDCFIIIFHQGASK